MRFRQVKSAKSLFLEVFNLDLIKSQDKKAILLFLFF